MTMQLTLRELRSIVREAVGTRSHPDDKTHMICWVLARAGRPMTRPEVMQKVEALEGKDPAAFKPTTNVDYWAPSPVLRGDWAINPDNPEGPYRQINKRPVPNTGIHARYSVLRRGFVKVAGKKGNQLLYELTLSGQRVAAEADEWIKSRSDLFGDTAGE
jgi:hypothetical protein